ncbi:MAG: Holliday junction resolvase RuvX [Pseudomonadota bacterium]
MSAPALENAEDFLREIGSAGPLLGLDLGTKTIGIAASDALRGIATPVETLKRTKFGKDAEALERIVSERAISGLVLGLPRNMDGSEGPRAQSTRAFARNFAARTQPGAKALPILLWDERLSTVAVERTLLEADASRARRAEVIDKMAAAYILQGVLDRFRALARAQNEEIGDEPW